MIAIIGLGNPGREYNWTRHNIGFEVIGKLAYDNNINMNKEKYKAIVGEGRIGNEKVLLIQPLTYMNLSGDSVREFVNFYKLSPEEIIVVCDEDEMKKLKGTSVLAECIRQFDIEVKMIEIETDLRDTLIEAQKRQRMVNA